MKKFLIIIFSIILLLAFSIQVNAETYVDESNGAYEPQVSISFTNSDHYTVEIPTSLKENDVSSITISNASLSEDKHISTYITNMNSNGYIDVENGDGDKAEMDVIVENSSCKYQKVSNYKVCTFDNEGGSREIKVVRKSDNSNAGIYTGVICFRFVIEGN